MTIKPKIEVFPDPRKLIQAAAEHLIEILSQGITEKGRVAVALSGGSTPRPIYSLLAGESYSGRIDWQKVHIFWGDERCVPPESPESNYRLARETLLESIPIPSGNVHRIHGEEDPEKAAVKYEKEMRAFFGVDTGRPSNWGFDLILLGMGENGHTASLFPGAPALREEERWVMAQYVEAVSMWRITLTPVVINAAKNILFVVSGTEKAERVRTVLEGPFQPEVLPAQIIRPVHGRLIWLLDKAAAGKLRSLRDVDRSMLLAL